MKLIILGTAGYHPNEQRHTACVMLPELGVVFDAGSAMFRVRELLQTSTLDIFLSHAHLDHVIGLTYLLDVLHEKQMDHVRVHGEADKLAAIDKHLFATALFPVAPKFFEPKPFRGEVSIPPDGTLRYFPIAHPGGAVGFRVDWPDRSMAYVSDTTAAPGAPYIEHIRGVDVLLHECNFMDGWEKFAETTGHSCTTPVAQVAAEAEVGLLVLTHVNPLSEDADPVGLDAALKVFPSTMIAMDGMEIDF